VPSWRTPSRTRTVIARSVPDRRRTRHRPRASSLSPKRTELAPNRPAARCNDHLGPLATRTRGPRMQIEVTDFVRGAFYALISGLLCWAAIGAAVYCLIQL
jgi:hypothetical protein